MKKALLILLCCITINNLFATNEIKFWDGIHDKTLSELKQQFKQPPVEFANHVIWGWEGNVNKSRIRTDLDSIKSKGFNSVIIEAGYRLPYKYLSEEWFKAIRTAVTEAKKRGMKVWIIDEGKYPSGFAGGKFSQERPDLRMQALVVCDTLNVKRGEAIDGKEIDKDIISAVALSQCGKTDRTVNIKNGKIYFKAGLSDWKILLVKSDFRTGATRAVNNPKGGKDTKNSLCDYMNPIAVQQYIDWTHEQYKKYIGNEFGKTVLGFRGDEPDYSHMPWTPGIVNKFKEKKGYDVTPYLASFFSSSPTIKEQMVKADYWDVWSDLFATNFFKLQADWCQKNGIAHITHLNKEHEMPSCIRVEGDYFRNLSKVQVPGVDAIWNQIWPGTVNDFPKLASSVAHVYGKERAFSESFAAYYTSPTIPQAKYVADYQIVRGINFFEYMFWMSGSTKPTWMSDPAMKGLNEYTNRTTYILTAGRPGARIAMYYPTSTMWMGNNDVYKDIVKLTQQLLTHQRDFDYVNDDALFEAITVKNGYLENKSGQRYYTLIIPSADAVSKKAWEKIKEFASQGGKVLFWGRKPSSCIGKTFTEPEPMTGLCNYTYEPNTDFTKRVETSLPKQELKIVSKANDSIRYTRRSMVDGDLFFIFNEGSRYENITVELDKVGTVKVWDSQNGTINGLESENIGGNTQIKLSLAPWESKIISVENSGKEYDIKEFGAKGDGINVETKEIQSAIDKCSQDGGGTIVIPSGKYLSGALFFPRGVNLRIDKGAVLISTVNPDDFPVIPTRFEGIERLWRCAFLNFDNSEGVRVYGEGTIDGKGVEWKTLPFGKFGRPRMLCFTGCNGGKISDIKMVNQASWCLHVLYTNGFQINDVDIRALEYIPSSDGIDIDSSNDVLINGAHIEAHDDCISIKSGRDSDGRRVSRPSENIVIENCHFAYGHGGVAMGSEISGGIRNVTIRKCIIDNENWSPLRFKSQPGRGGIVENITFEDIKITGARNIFDINMEWRMVPPLEPAFYPLTRLRNIHFKNIYGEAKSVGTMYGFKESPFKDDTFFFENCHIKADKGLSTSNADNINFQGLELEVKDGEKIFNRTH